MSACLRAEPHLHSRAAGIAATAAETRRAALGGVEGEVGDDVGDGDGVVGGMPAIVIGDHGDGDVTDFGFAGELGLLQVGHADDVHAPASIEIGFGFG